MKFKITPTQQDLLDLGKEKGFLTLDDFDTAYTSPISVKRNIKRFKLLGLLKDTEVPGKFEYVEQENE